MSDETHITDQDEDQAIAPKSGRLLAWLLAGGLAFVLMACLLPHDPYLRVQQLSHTIHFRTQWSYERTHFDDTPIDIAVIGNSRLAAGVNAPLVAELMSKAQGAPVRVVNFSTPQEGRNTHFALAEDLLEMRSDVKLILLSVVEQAPRVTHPAFRHLGDAGDVIMAPKLINRDYFADLAYLPYRQIALFVQSFAPARFGYDAEFDATGYRGPDYNTTSTYTLPDGGIIDRDIAPPEPELAAAAKRRIRGVRPPALPAALEDWEFSVERHYTKAIVELAAEKGVKIAFLYLPIYSDQGGVRDKAAYEAYGPLLEATPWIDQAEAFSDYGHFNQTGSTGLASWLAPQLSALLEN